MAFEHGEITEQIIGSAFEVHRELGYGFLEKVGRQKVEFKRMVFWTTEKSVFHLCSICGKWILSQWLTQKGEEMNAINRRFAFE